MSDKANWVNTTQVENGDIQFTGTLRVDGGSKFSIVDPTDSTKSVIFNLSGLPTATQTEFTVPDSDSSLVTLTATQTLTNKTLTAPVITDATIGVVDSGFTIADNTTPTKIAAFQCSGLTAGTNVFTFPNTAADTLVTLAANQTLTTKTLTSPTINAATISGDFSSSATITGGTLAPTTLTVPSGTTLPTPTLTGTMTATGATISAGTIAPTVLTVPASTSMTTPALVSATLTAQATDAAIGTVAAPVSGTTAVTIARVGNLFYLTFTLTAARIAVTDDVALGSYGSTKIFDFVEAGLTFLGCRQNYTAYTPDGTGVPDDDAFVIGIGTTPIAAPANATLAAAEQNVGASLAQTLVAGTTTGTKFTGAGTAIDGTGTAADLYLNWSGSTATTDGNGTIDVTATFTVVASLLGDD